MSRMLSFTTPPGRRPATVPGRAAAEPTPSRRFPLRASCRRAGTAGPSRSPSGRGCPSPRNATAPPGHLRAAETLDPRSAEIQQYRGPRLLEEDPYGAIAGRPARFRRAVLLGPGQSKYFSCRGPRPPQQGPGRGRPAAKSSRHRRRRPPSWASSWTDCAMRGSSRPRAASSPGLVSWLRAMALRRLNDQVRFARAQAQQRASRAAANRAGPDVAVRASEPGGPERGDG